MEFIYQVNYNNVNFFNDRDFDKNLRNLYDQINKRINVSSQSATVSDNQNIDEIRLMEENTILRQQQMEENDKGICCFIT